MSTTRRSFLLGGLQVTCALPLFARGRRLPRPAGDRRVLVVVQLTGGNDGLNTVVPFRQDGYFRARPTLALGRGSLHALDDDHGLHPQLRGLGELFQEGRLAIVHGVGLPLPNRSHFRSMEIWHTADPEGSPPSAGTTGWLGRLADQISAASPGTLAAMHVGEGSLPLALRGRESLAPSVPDAGALRLEDLSPGFARSRAALLRKAGDAASAGEPLAFLRTAAESTYRAAARMEQAVSAGPRVAYPDLPLARRLQLIARLIEGDFGTRVFHLEHGGFDTHARQQRTHAALLGELSRSLTAFQRDLEAAGAADRVVTFAFSEFGRRAAENGSRGTDHGAGAPAFLLGAVRGGLHGRAPDLERLADGDVPASTDFRAVYSELERGWLGLRPSSDVPPLPLVAG